MRTQEDLGGGGGGKLQEQKRKVLKLITGMKIGNRRKVKRFMRINGNNRMLAWPRSKRKALDDFIFPVLTKR